MRLCVFAYTRRGCETALRLTDALVGNELSFFAPDRLSGGEFHPIPSPSEAFYGERFRNSDALIFVGAAGIAVREIAPHIRHKAADPAVLCLDEQAQFVIPLLSGHIGGANGLARALAAALGAVPVITTATDVERRVSIDAWAARNGCVIDDLGAAKRVSAAVLEGEVPFCSEFPISGPLPPGLVPGEAGPLGVYVGVRRTAPFACTLRLIPRVLHLGLGCRRGTPAESVRRAVDSVLEREKLDRRALKDAASIDLKADEAGLLEFCREAGLPVSFFSSTALAAVEGEFSASAFVASVAGVDNVCERAAMLGGGRRLIVNKTALEGVTVALAAEQWEVRFGEAVCGGDRPR